MGNVIIVGTDHYNTLWMVRCLGMVGFNPYVIIVSSKEHSFVAKSKYCSECVLVDSNDSMLSILLERDTEGKVPIFTSGDAIAKYLDNRLDLLSGKYILQNCNGKQGDLSYWMNKNNMLRLASDCGLIIPLTKSFSTAQNIDCSQIPFPCLVKPELSAEASKDNFRICNDAHEFEVALREIKDNCSRVIVQEYIKSEYEYLVYGVSTNEGICTPGGLRKIHVCTSNKNLGMLSYACLSSELPPQIESFDKIDKFVRTLGYKGLFSVEFLITKDKAYFLEINLRNDGTCYITAEAGVNMPAIWACSVMGLDSSHLSKTFKRERTYGMNEINYIKYTLSIRSLLKCLKEVSKVNVFSIIRLEDMRPFFFKIIYGLLY